MAMNIVFIDGQFIDETKACVPVMNRGFLFGEGVFTTIRISDGAPEYLDRHFERLKSHCLELGISPPNLQKETILELIRLNHAEKGIWRLKVIITDNLLITIAPYAIQECPVKLITYPKPFSSPIAHLKTLSYLPRIHFKKYAEKQGFDDVLVKSPEGWILETAIANIFWEVDGEFFTPKRDLPLLQGVTLSVLMEKFNFQEVHAAEIPRSASVYTINSMQKVRPVVQIDEIIYSNLERFTCAGSHGFF